MLRFAAAVTIAEAYWSLAATRDKLCAGKSSNSQHSTEQFCEGKLLLSAMPLRAD
jgi:hypothetical protein